MYKKPEAKLLPLDTELERTKRNLRKVKSLVNNYGISERKNATYSRRRRRSIKTSEANDYG